METILLGIIVIFICILAYVVYNIINRELERVEKQERAYERYLVDNKNSGYKLPPIDITTRYYFIVDKNGIAYNMKEWETDNHDYSQYVSNHKNHTINNE